MKWSNNVEQLNVQRKDVHIPIICGDRWCFYTSLVMTAGKQSSGRQRCRLDVLRNSWLGGNCNSLGNHFLSYSARYWALPRVSRAHTCREMNGAQMKTLKLPWHNLERGGNIWNRQLLWCTSSCEKMDGFTDVADKLINPVAPTVWAPSQSTLGKWGMLSYIRCDGLVYNMILFNLWLPESWFIWTFRVKQ